MKNIIIPILAVLLVVIVGIFLYQNQNTAPSVHVEEDFGSKIVYTTETSQDTADFIAHCENREGTFNECGTPCAPDAEICAQVCAFTCENIGEDTTSVDTSAWGEFKSNEYHFSLRYPATEWNQEVDTSFDFSPKFNFYVKPAGMPVEPPFDHFDNISNVSIFPSGIPTEGVFGEKRPFNLSVPFEVTDTSQLYVLEDGTPFAAYIQPVQKPSSWNDSGFIWVRVRIEDLESRCVRDGVTVSQEECDPLTQDDRIVRTGSVDTDVWEQQKAVLRSIEFLSE